MIEVFKSEDLELSFSFDRYLKFDDVMKMNWRKRNSSNWALETFGTPKVESFSFTDFQDLISNLKIADDYKNHVLFLMSDYPKPDREFFRHFLFKNTDYVFVSNSRSYDEVRLAKKKDVLRICRNICSRLLNSVFRGAEYSSNGYYRIHFDCHKDFVLVTKDGLLQLFNFDEYKDLIRKPTELRAIIDYLIHELEEVKNIE